ncbi:MAG: PAS domain S-box protein [Candidatus Auribacterota bacterium]
MELYGYLIKCEAVLSVFLIVYLFFFLVKVPFCKHLISAAAFFVLLFAYNTASIKLNSPVNEGTPYFWHRVQLVSVLLVPVSLIWFIYRFSSNLDLYRKASKLLTVLLCLSALSAMLVPGNVLFANQSGQESAYGRNILLYALIMPVIASYYFLIYVTFSKSVYKRQFMRILFLSAFSMVAAGSAAYFAFHLSVLTGNAYFEYSAASMFIVVMFLLTDQFSCNIQGSDLKRNVELQYKLLMENMPIKMFYKNTQSVYVFCSKSFARVMNVSPAEIAGKTDDDLMPKHLAEKYRADDRRIMAEKTTEEFDDEFIEDGQIKIARTTKTAVLNEKGEVIGILGSFLDVTEHRHTENILRNSKKEISLLLNNLPGMVYRCKNDHSWTMIFVSDGCKDLTGYGKEDLLNNHTISYNDITHPDDRQYIWDTIQKHKDKNEQYQLVYRIKTAGGEEKWVWERGWFILDSTTGNFLYLEGFITDITAQKNTEQKLKESEQTLRTILQAAPIGIGLITNRIFKWVNNRMAQMVGYTPDELVNKNARMLYPSEEEYLRVGREKHTDVLKTGFGQIETQMIHKDGHLLDILLSSASLVHGDLSAGMIFTMNDITEQKKAQDQCNLLIDKLERQNAELENFTYTVSHDLKSPLITIEGFVGFLKRNPAVAKNKDAHEMLVRITNAASKMRKLLDDLLELSRIGRLVNPSEECSMNAIVDEAIELTSGRLSSHRVTVSVAPGLPTVTCDRQRMVQVMVNLIDNAAKFTEGVEHPQITIGMRSTGKENIIFVSDNGIGIEKQYFGTIFGLFNKLNNESEGTGVGLSLVKRIIEFHGGKIWVESEGIDKGCEFCFTLPVK